MKTYDGFVLTSDDIAQKIQERREASADEKGVVPVTTKHYKPHQTTLDNYMAEIANKVGVHIATSSNQKTNTRYTAENSLISSMCLLVLIACTHFVPVKENDKDVSKLLRHTEENGVRLMYDLVRKANKNLHMHPIAPEYIYSTDDTTDYIFEGKGEKKEKFVLASSRTMAKSGSRSRYTQEDTKHMCGLRVKLTHTFSAAGVTAPIFISVLGLTTREMPNHQCISINIKGLCIGGDGVNVGCEQQGTVIFMRNDTNGGDIQRFKIYRDEILLPFISKSREEFSGFWREGMPIPPELTAISWCDGDLSQISNITCIESIQLYNEKKIIANEQNAARSGTEQAADLAKSFKIMHKLQKEVTVSNKTYQTHPMNRKVAAAFESLHHEKRLLLKPSKKKALIDFISCLPQMITKAVTHSNVVHGFKQNGMVDHKHMRVPDFDSIIATCRKDPTIEEYNLCVDSFPYLYEKMMEDGHINDSVFEELGFPLDMNSGGGHVRRDATISQESQQRAKCLTHQSQVEIRQERINKLQAEVVRNKLEKLEHLQHCLDQNTNCEEKIKKMLETQNGNVNKDNNVSTATCETLARLTVGDLTSFILSRNLELSKSKLPKKGKVEEAIRGESNLISLAFSLRSKENLLQKKVNASELLGNDAWVDCVWNCFHTSSALHHFPTVTDEIKSKADDLQTKLHHRLSKHLVSRINDPKKQESWCWRWCHRNFGCIAAIMMILGHVKEDFETLDEQYTLLDDEYNFVEVEGSEVEQTGGAYLYFDKNHKRWVRSGKVSWRRSFLHRHNEHTKKAKATFLTGGGGSKLYKLYPSQSSSRSQTSTIRRGYWENLGLFCAISIPGDDMVSLSKICRNQKEQGIFVYNEFEITKISELGKDGNEKDNRLEVIAYLFELAYDLCISVHDNVSESVGFEKCIGGC